jgi:hypothetical protein
MPASGETPGRPGTPRAWRAGAGPDLRPLLVLAAGGRPGQALDGAGHRVDGDVDPRARVVRQRAPEEDQARARDLMRAAGIDPQHARAGGVDLVADDHHVPAGPRRHRPAGDAHALAGPHSQQRRQQLGVEADELRVAGQVRRLDDHDGGVRRHGARRRQDGGEIERLRRRDACEGGPGGGRHCRREGGDDCDQDQRERRPRMGAGAGRSTAKLQHETLLYSRRAARCDA